VVGAVLIAIGLEYTNPGQDDVQWEIRQEGDITDGKVVGHHECIKVWAREAVKGLASAIKIQCDCIFSQVLASCQVDVSKSG
jgi:hypothetical protein